MATYKGSTVRIALRPADRRPDEISRAPGQNHGARRFYSVPAGQDADAPKQGGDHQRRRGDVAAGSAAQVIDEVVSDRADVGAACGLGIGLRRERHSRGGCGGQAVPEPEHPDRNAGYQPVVKILIIRLLQVKVPLDSR